MSLGSSIFVTINVFPFVVTFLVYRIYAAKAANKYFDLRLRNWVENGFRVGVVCALRVRFLAVRCGNLTSYEPFTVKYDNTKSKEARRTRKRQAADPTRRFEH